ncbi:MAG: DNA repair protein RadC [Akkermansia sp.]|nr:DNA repair protein RadC [Akkermansia sp.]
MSNIEEPTLQLRDMNKGDLPRERLLREGRAALTDEELIAIFLRTGLHGCNVLELAARLKRSAGSLAALGRLDAREIAHSCKGIGKAKAATLAAVFELGQRAVREELTQQQITTSQQVYNLLAGELRFETVENLVLLLLDTHRRLLRRVNLGRGTLTNVLTHPRNIFREVILNHAAGFVLVHNHPSGRPVPSKSDDKLTDTVAAAAKIMCVPLVDHVIIGSPTEGQELPYYSYRDHGRIIK